MQTLGINLADVFNALRRRWAARNDLNLFGRTWQLNQGEQEDRESIDDIYRIHVRNAKGEMAPLRSFAEVRTIIGPQAIVRYNNYRSVTINGSPARGQLGQALAAMEQLSAETLPQGYSFEWTGTALQERRRRARPRSSSGWRCCSPTCSWWPSTRAGPSRCRCCSR